MGDDNVKPIGPQGVTAEFLLRRATHDLESTLGIVIVELKNDGKVMCSWAGSANKPLQIANLVVMSQVLQMKTQDLLRQASQPQ